MRTILHCDMNNFYASVECLYHPELRGGPVAVCGDPALRHGIVLAKNQQAKAAGVCTGDPIREAERKCPGLVIVPARFEQYLRFSRMAHEIYAEYTDQVESFGLDECWLDVTGSAGLYGSGERIADELRARIRDEMGITASVGVSYNKIFAKLGSDLHKPDATTVIPYAHYREIVWPLPVEALLYVGRATAGRLRRACIHTIGELATAHPPYIRRLLGRNGAVLQAFANGQDTSPVSRIDALPLVKSVGNSTTTPRDLTTDTEVRVTLYALAESVAARLREQGCRASVVTLYVRNKELACMERQHRLPRPTFASGDLADAAFALFARHCPAPFAVRSLGIQAGSLSDHATEQLSFAPDALRSRKRETIDGVMDGLRRRFGQDSIQRGVLLEEPDLSINPKEDHVIHPVSFRR